MRKGHIMKKKFNYGGMAVIEGVMMRGPNRTAVAVRKPDGEVTVEVEENRPASRRFPFLKWPFIRGTYVLISSLAVGMRMLNRSANLSLEAEDEELSTMEIVFTMLLAFALAMGLFVAAPTALVHFTRDHLGSIFWQNVVEGIVRIVFFLLYILAISRMQDIRRVFMYHGAEHKTIFTLEAGEDLIPENARKYSTLHPRCGTSFLLVVMVISILVFALLGDGSLWYRIWSRIAVFPIVAGLGYEFIRASGRFYDRRWARWIMAPGLHLQKLTTGEPDDDMLEVAICALEAVMEPPPERLVAAAAVEEARSAVQGEIEDDQGGKAAC